MSHPTRFVHDSFNAEAEDEPHQGNTRLDEARKPRLEARGRNADGIKQRREFAFPIRPDGSGELRVAAAVLGDDNRLQNIVSVPTKALVQIGNQPIKSAEVLRTTDSPGGPLESKLPLWPPLVAPPCGWCDSRCPPRHVLTRRHVARGIKLRTDFY
jgi:hypothetical protein